MKFGNVSLAGWTNATEAGTLTFILTPPEGMSSTARQMIDGANPLLRKSRHYLNIHCGFATAERPYFITEWQDQQNDRPQGALERRWLARELVERANQLTAAAHWQVILDADCGPDQLAIAEDIYRSTCDKLDGRSALKSFAIHAPDWNSVDPHKDVRMCHLLGYRDWVNQNPDEMTSLAIERHLHAFAQQNQCEFTSYDVPQLTELGLNLLLAVGQASTRSPSRLILLSKNWQKGGESPLLLVGKGITFDTGGINVKAHEHFVNCMKNDMGGAALMSHLFMALVESGYKKPLVLAIPACENLVDGNAMKPGSVVRSYAGKRVMIEHTDAEGRLILADALAYANDVYHPHTTLVAATLTTAALRQFSNFFTPVHFADVSLQEKIQRASEKWGEGFAFWQRFLPFLDSNKAKVGELTNMGRMPKDASIGGGSNVAAHFLKEFCPSPMVHFDIFATTWNWSGDYPGASYGATGAPFNSLFDTLLQF